MFGLQPKLSRERAEKLVRQGKTAAAIEIYERLLETDRGNSNLIMPLGDLYARAGRNSDAARLFRGLAEQLDTDGYHGRAAALWRKILKFEPDSMEVETRLARSLLAQGSRIEAATALHQVIERAEKHKQWKAAAEAYALLARAETPRTETCLHWGRALAQSGETASAQARLLAGLELATTAKTPQLSLAASLLRELEILDPRWPPYRLARAELASWSGDAAGVLKWLPEPGSLPDAAATARAWRLAAQSGELDLAGSWARAAIESGADETARAFGLFLLELNDSDRLTAWVCDAELLRREALRQHWLALFETWSQRCEVPMPALQAWLNLVAGRDAVLEAQLRSRLAHPADPGLTTSTPEIPATATPAPADAIVIEPEAADFISSIQEPSAAVVSAPGPEISTPAIASPPPEPRADVTLETGFDADGAETVIELDLSQPWTDAVAGAEAADGMDSDASAAADFEINANVVAEADDAVVADVSAIMDSDASAVADFEINASVVAEADDAVAADVSAIMDSDASAVADFEINASVAAEADDAVAADVSAEVDSDAAWAEASPEIQPCPEPAAPAAMDLPARPAVPPVPPVAIAPAVTPVVIAPAVPPVTTAPVVPPVVTASSSPPAAFAPEVSPELPPPSGSPVFSTPPDADPFLRDLALELNVSPDPLPSVVPPATPGANGAARPAPTVTTQVLAGVLAEFERGLPELGGQPSSAERHMHTGMALREMGLWEEAIAELQRAHNAWPPASDFDSQRRACAAYLGECFTRLDLPESALPWYRRVLADPAIPPAAWQGAAYETAAVLERLGEYSEAARLLQRIYAENVDFLDVGERLRRLRSRLAAATSA